MNGFYGFGRDALLLETLSIVAKCQDPQNFWSDAIARLKWILDFTRVDVALLNPDGQTYSLQTVFELRPMALASEAALPLTKGIVGEMLRSGEACHCFKPRAEPFKKEGIADESLEGGSLRSVLSVSLEANRKVLGVVSFGSDEHVYCHQDVEIASRFATHAAIAIQNWQHLARLKEDAILLDAAGEKLRDSQSVLESLVVERTAALRSVSHRLLKIQEDERRRIARDLHDSTSQILAGLMMSIASLQKQFGEKESTYGTLAEISGMAGHALQEIRTSSYLLHPPLLDQAGLAAAARWYVDGFSKRSGVRVSLDFPLDGERLPSPVEMALFRVLQECLTNVHRHSGASMVKIRLEQTAAGEVLLEVRDNGHGIAPELLEHLRKTSMDTGVGLAGMRERLDDVNGVLEMESGSQGTTLRVRVALVHADLPVNPGGTGNQARSAA